MDDGAVCLRHIMQWLKLIDGEPVAPENTWVTKGFPGLRAQRPSGRFECRTKASFARALRTSD